MPPMTDRREVFRRLHQSGCFVIPNPWDLGSARLLARLGFPALATTSSGFAWSLGRADNHVSLDEALGHLRSIAGGVDLPVNADFEGGFAVEPAEVGANVAPAAGTGDRGALDRGFDRRRLASPVRFRPLGRARPRRAAGASMPAARACCSPAARRGSSWAPDLGETIRRLTAYAEAGADCLYAPGLRTRPTSRRWWRRSLRTR